MSALRITLSAAALLFLAIAPAKADCAALIAEFDRAKAAKSVERVTKSAADIKTDFECGERADEFKEKEIDFLIATLGDAAAPEPARRQSRAILDKRLPADGTWRQAAAFGDYLMAGGQRSEAAAWYDRAVKFMTIKPATPATAKDRLNLLARAAAAKNLASDDQGGAKKVAFNETTRDEVDGRIGGIYSPVLLRGATAVAIPLPINFYTNETRLTPVGEKALAELAQAAKEQDVPQMVLVGHADPRGSAQYNLDLSRRRVEAVRDALLGYFRKEGRGPQRIDVQWKGAQEPFAIDSLPYKLSDEDRWSLDRRVEWLRGGE